LGALGAVQDSGGGAAILHQLLLTTAPAACNRRGHVDLRQATTHPPTQPTNQSPLQRSRPATPGAGGVLDKVVADVQRARERAGDALGRLGKAVTGGSVAEEVLKRSCGAWAVVLVPVGWEATPAPSVGGDGSEGAVAAGAGDE